MLNSYMLFTIADKITNGGGSGSGDMFANESLFPFPFPLHLIFCAIGLFFFIYRFATDKKPFQLIMALAIPFSLSLWISDSRTWFYAVGLIELILTLIAFITSIVFRNKNKSADDSKDVQSDNSEVSE
ncbi:MAG: hypothetical protein K2H19_09825 [Ruminococcus sp.]|nr:hypothetical protein [Ruminococcus sp.]